MWAPLTSVAGAPVSGYMPGQVFVVRSQPLLSAKVPPMNPTPRSTRPAVAGVTSTFTSGSTGCAGFVTTPAGPSSHSALIEWAGLLTSVRVLYVGVRFGVIGRSSVWRLPGNCAAAAPVLTGTVTLLPEPGTTDAPVPAGIA